MAADHAGAGASGGAALVRVLCTQTIKVVHAAAVNLDTGRQ